MFAEIVEGPLGMACLAAYVFHLSLVGRMLHEGDGVLFSVTAMEKENTLPSHNLRWQRVLQFLSEVASLTGRFFSSLFHQFPA